MKFQVYSDKVIFENLVQEKEKYSNWNNILKYHSEVYIDMSQDDFDLDIADPENSILFQYIQEAHGRAPIPNEQFFQDFENDNSIVLNAPLSTYLIEKDDETIQALSEKFGLIFQNSNIDDKVVSNTYFKNFKKDSQFQNGAKKGWETLDIYFPLNMNSLVVTEEHLFHNVETVRGKRVNVGLINLVNFLNLVLPKNLGTEFHLTVVTEMKGAIPTDIMAQEYYDVINHELKNLRPYIIIFELVFTKETLHNRSAYSNYQVITLDKGYKVFKPFDNITVIEKNKLTINQIFLVSEPNGSDTHFQEILDDLPIIKKGITESTKYVKNKGFGQPPFKCFGFPSTMLSQNRLLNYFP